MTFFSAIFLGIVQGLAEFLPISSSGHLAIFQNFFGMTNYEEENLFFDVLLHLGTLVSVCVVYRSDILEMIREFFRYIAGLAKRERPDGNIPARRMILLIIMGTLPLLLVLPVKDHVEGLYNNTIFIGCALIATGLLLYISDRMKKKGKTERSASIADALIVGCAQAVAVVPGLSRSGSTIAAGLFRGFERSFAVRYSFLLSLPAVLGANIISLADALEAEIDTTLVPMYIAGVVTAMVSGYLAIKFLKYITEKGSFGGFAYYCWAVGAATVILSLIV